MKTFFREQILLRHFIALHIIGLARMSIEIDLIKSIWCNSSICVAVRQCKHWDNRRMQTAGWQIPKWDLSQATDLQCSTTFCYVHHRRPPFSIVTLKSGQQWSAYSNVRFISISLVPFGDLSVTQRRNLSPLGNLRHQAYNTWRNVTCLFCRE